MNRIGLLPIIIVIGLLASASFSAPPASAPSGADIEITTLNPAVNSSDGLCSLSEAILNANGNDTSGSPDCPAGVDSQDEITFKEPGPIVLGAALPTITDGLIIHGNSGGTSINGADTYRVLNYSTSSSATLLILEELTLEHGNAGTGYGGALQKLTGAVEIRSSTLRYNQAASGGAVFNGAGNMTMVDCTLYGNSATSGLSSNGGALINGAGWTLMVLNSTFLENRAFTGGSHIYNASGLISAYNSIFADGFRTSNCGGTITNMGNNIDTGSSCGFGTANGSLSDTESQLGTPGAYGGPTDTIPLLSNSPAIDGVTFNTPNSCPDWDQRNIERPIDGDGDLVAICDIGAYEYGEPRVFLPVILR